MNIKQKLANIYTTLNQIEIKGDKNIEYMYGVLVTISGLIAEAEQQEQNDSQDIKNNQNKEV